MIMLQLWQRSVSQCTILKPNLAARLSFDALALTYCVVMLCTPRPGLQKFASKDCNDNVVANCGVDSFGVN